MALLAILDIDGTLVDTNYQHAIAWYRAFRDHDETLPVARLHRAIGMGGDQLVAHVVGAEFERRHGDSTRAAEKSHYGEMIGEVRPLPGAIDLVHRLAELGHSVVLASSARGEEVEHYLDLLDVREVAAGWTTSDDVERTKPAPDLVHAAKERVAEHDRAVMLGDSVYDCEAAARAGVPTVGLLTGGFSAAELEEAGAIAVYDTPASLLDQLGETPFA